MTIYGSGTRPLTPEEMESITPKELPSEYGLIPGLQVDDPHIGGEWRCCNCSRMQARDAPLVWVSDRVKISDGWRLVAEVQRRGYWSGGGDGWCMPCAQALSRPYRTHMRWKKIKGWFFGSRQKKAPQNKHSPR
jgi:hypothetical protein